VIALLPVYVIELLVLTFPLMQNVIKHSQKKIKKLKAVVSGHQDLAAKEKRISEELTKNIYLQRELDKLKQERTRETWLLKNDLRNLEKANSELQEQLKEQKKAHQRKPLSSLEYFPLTIYLGFLKYLHRRA
jgi:septal ring factor EnvC (AmiA/AmiB activator)